jgi:hypothetical protein
MRQYSLFSVNDKLSYVTDLLESCLSRAQGADVRSLFDNPGNIEERANALDKVAYEKGKEIYGDVGADEESLVGRTAASYS